MTRNGPASARRVLCVGRLDPMKGQEDLADAARLLHPRVPFELDFVGEGDAVALQHKSSGLPVRVRGGLGAPEFEALLAAADVVVVPSRVLARHGLRESSPIVVGEAMAAGVPVVATRTGGIPDLIVDGQTGLLVEPNSPPNLAQAIERLLVSATLRAELARNGRRAVAARAWPAVAKATLDAYDAFVPA